MTKKDYTCKQDRRVNERVLSGLGYLVKGDKAFSKIQRIVVMDDFGLWQFGTPFAAEGILRQHVDSCAPCDETYRQEFADVYVCPDSGITDFDLENAGSAALGVGYRGVDQWLRAYRYEDITEALKRAHATFNASALTSFGMERRELTADEIREASENIGWREVLYLSDHAERCSPCTPYFKDAGKLALKLLLAGDRSRTG